MNGGGSVRLASNCLVVLLQGDGSGSGVLTPIQRLPRGGAPLVRDAVPIDGSANSNAADSTGTLDLAKLLLLKRVEQIVNYPSVREFHTISQLIAE